MFFSDYCIFWKAICNQLRLALQLSLSIIGARGGVAAVTRPVGVEELTARRVQPLVGVRAEVIALRLQEIC